MKILKVKAVVLSLGCFFGVVLASHASTLVEYRFDTISGDNKTFFDSSGNDRNANLFSAATLSTNFPFSSTYPELVGIDKSGEWLDTVWVDGAIQNAASMFGSATSFTLQGWMSPATLANGSDMISLSGTGTARIQLGFDTGGGIYGFFRNSLGEDVQINGPVLALNTWTHLALTYDGAAMNLFVNGSSAGSVNIAAGSLSGINGGYIVAGGRQYAGLVDDFGIYDTALTSSQLGYNTPFTPVPEPEAITLLCLGLLVVTLFCRRNLRSTGRLQTINC